MYNCRFVAEDGRNFRFGYEYGTIFDLSPLSEINVDVSTSQGFQQVGTTVEAETVGGVSRTLSGKFLDTSRDLPDRMLRTFVPGTHGKLYFGDDYYCDCVVQKVPAISLAAGKRDFSLMLYCAYPYWMQDVESAYILGGYTAAFEFPVCYDSHTFGVKSSALFTNCRNDGMVSVPYAVQFRAGAPVTNYGILNAATGEKLSLTDSLALGDVVTVYRDNGRLKVEKESGGVTTDIFSRLDEDSTLFSLAVGDNIIKMTADNGVDNLTAYVTLNPAFVGVLA